MEERRVDCIYKGIRPLPIHPDKYVDCGARKPVRPVDAMNTSGRRGDVLAVLQASDSPLSIVDIARRLGVHPNTVRYHLEALTENGRVETVEPERAGPGRPALMFQARQGMDPSGPRNYRLLAEVLAASVSADPDPANRAIEAGRTWGSRLAVVPSEESGPSDDQAIHQLLSLLDAIGFAPQRRSEAGEKQIGLRHCPFLDLIDTQARVICPLHLGIMQGAMTAMRATVTVNQLDPFAEPDLCLAHLGPVDTGS